MTISQKARDLIHGRFWIEWTNKFEESADTLITPDNMDVMDEFNAAGTSEDETPLQNKLTLWNHVHELIQYTVTDEWQTPAQTLERGKGDCEDYSFLMASLLEYLDPDENCIQVGYMDYPDGRTEEHVWNMADGLLIDATGSPDAVGSMGYRPVREFQIERI